MTNNQLAKSESISDSDSALASASASGTTSASVSKLAIKSIAASKVYVLDTSVLLADPMSIQRFAEHEVIIPITVIGELESKRNHPRSESTRLNSSHVKRSRMPSSA